jgi:hypothetical protein
MSIPVDSGGTGDGTGHRHAGDGPDPAAHASDDGSAESFQAKHNAHVIGSHRERRDYDSRRSPQG